MYMIHGAHKYSMDIFYKCYIMNNHAGLSLRVGGYEFSLNYIGNYKNTKNQEDRNQKKKIIVPKEIPSCLVPNLLIVFTQQCEILVVHSPVMELYVETIFFLFCVCVVSSSYVLFGPQVVCLICVCTGYSLLNVRV